MEFCLVDINWFIVLVLVNPMSNTFNHTNSIQTKSLNKTFFKSTEKNKISTEIYQKGFFLSGSNSLADPEKSHIIYDIREWKVQRDTYKMWICLSCCAGRVHTWNAQLDFVRILEFQNSEFYCAPKMSRNFVSEVTVEPTNTFTTKHNAETERIALYNKWY